MGGIGTKFSRKNLTRLLLPLLKLQRVLVAMYRGSLLIAVLAYLARTVCGQGATALRLGEAYSFTLQSRALQSFAFELSPFVPPNEQVCNHG